MKPDQHRNRSNAEEIGEEESEEEEEQEYKRVNQTAKTLWELDLEDVEAFGEGDDEV